MIHGGVDRGGGWWGIVRSMSGAVWLVMMMMMMTRGSESRWRVLAIVGGGGGRSVAGADGRFGSLLGFTPFLSLFFLIFFYWYVYQILFVKSFLDVSGGGG